MSNAQGSNHGLPRITVSAVDPMNLGRGTVEVDGAQLSGIKRITIDVTNDGVPTVGVAMFAGPLDFDAYGRFEPLLELAEFEERAALELYEVLRERFEGREGRDAP